VPGSAPPPVVGAAKRDSISIALSVSVVTSVRMAIASVAAAWLPTQQPGASRLRHAGAPETGHSLPPLQHEKVDMPVENLLGHIYILYLLFHGLLTP
jgi:hypothetical protein